MPDALNAAPHDPALTQPLLDAIIASLDDDQALDVQTIPLAGKSTIADYMVVASGRSTRQVASMANKLAEKVHRDFRQTVKMEGLATADWVLLDAGDVIVHIFRPEVRVFYNLEKMWAMDPPTAERLRPEA